MVIDSVVQICVAGALFLVVPVADRASEFSVAAAIGDAAEFFDVDVDQVAGSVVFIAAWRGPAHR